MRRRRRALGGPACRLPTPWASARCVRWGRLGGGWRRDSGLGGLGSAGAGPREVGCTPESRHQGRPAPGHVPVAATSGRAAPAIRPQVPRTRRPPQLAGARQARTEGKPSSGGDGVGQEAGEKHAGQDQAPGGLSKWKPRVRSKLRCAPEAGPVLRDQGAGRGPHFRGPGLGRAPGVRAALGGRGAPGDAAPSLLHGAAPPARPPSASNTEL